MKAGIITHYDVHNHGAQLQLFGLITYLRNIGIDAKALTYTKNYDFLESGVENKYNISIKSIGIYLRYLFSNGIRQTLFNYKKRKQLIAFRKKHELVGDFYSKTQLLDYLVVGSDEVFSFEAGINPFFWGFGVKYKKAFSYAASFGPTTTAFLEKCNCINFIKGGVLNFNALSVRDQNSFDIIRDSTGIEPAIVCDPVFLYGFKDEIGKYKDLKREYLLVYSYDKNMNDTKTINQIKQFAKTNGLSIISVGYYHKWCHKNINTNPLEIFKYFCQATFVITDTFHGTVLSLITNTSFVAKLSGNQNKLRFLLTQYDLESRIIDSFDSLQILFEEPIDYRNVEIKIQNERNKAEAFIKGSL